MGTFSMDPSIARTKATICICFVDGIKLDRCVSLDCLEIGYESRLGRTSSLGAVGAHFFAETRKYGNTEIRKYGFKFHILPC
jgi:hypothetical protein